MGAVVVFLFGVALYGTTFILPQFTQQLLGYTAYQSGLVLMPRALALMLIVPLAGQLYNKFDPRWLIIGGVLVVCLSYVQLAHLATMVAKENFVPILILMGAGMSFIFVPLTTVSLSTVEKENTTSASGSYNLFQQVGGNIGYALMATLLDRNTQSHRAYLVEHISQFNLNFVNFTHQTVQFFYRQGMALTAAKNTAMALANSLVDQQSAMLAYNDISLFLMLMFFLCVPFVLMIPAPKGPDKLTKKDNSSIQLLAYQIHQEKGGSEIDNWLEAEQNVRQ